MKNAEDRAYMVQIIKQAVGGCAEYWAGLIADALIAHGVTPQKWIPVEEEVPELKDWSYASTMVIGCYDTGSVTPMKYERSIVRGKPVERWRTYYDRLCDPPMCWMPLPEPPKKED